MKLTPDQLRHGVSLRRLTDEVRAAQLQARLGKPMPDMTEIQRAAQEGMELLDLERNGNHSILKRRLDARAALMDRVAREENSALRFALQLAIKLKNA